MKRRKALEIGGVDVNATFNQVVSTFQAPIFNGVMKWETSIHILHLKSYGIIFSFFIRQG